MTTLPAKQVYALLRTAAAFSRSAEGKRLLAEVPSELVSEVNHFMRQPGSDLAILALCSVALNSRPFLTPNGESHPPLPFLDAIPDGPPPLLLDKVSSSNSETLNTHTSNGLCLKPMLSGDSKAHGILLGKRERSRSKETSTFYSEGEDQQATMMALLSSRDSVYAMSPNTILGEAASRFWKIANLWPVAKRPMIRRASLLYRSFVEEQQDEVKILRTAAEYVEETDPKYLKRFDLWLEQQPWQG